MLTLLSRNAQQAGPETDGALVAAPKPSAKAIEQAKAQTELPKLSAPTPAKAGRNDPCPCGSGKKFKNCHGA